MVEPQMHKASFRHCLVWFTAAVTIVNPLFLAQALVPIVTFPCGRTPLPFRSGNTRLASSVGGGPPPSSGDGGNGKSGGWDDFLRGEESENMIRAREYFSENSLPINYDPKASDATKDEEEEEDEDDDDDDEDEDDVMYKSRLAGSSALARPNSSGLQPFSSFGQDPDVLASNPYISAVSKISPSELISKFTSTAHPRVQNAVRGTILSLIGGLPKMAFETTTITTGQRLASLMFQLQMTGYMFKNAEYRLSLQQSIGSSSSDFLEKSKFLLEGTSDEMAEDKKPLDGKIKGKLRVRYGKKKEDSAKNNGEEGDVEPDDSVLNSTSLEVEVDAAAYMSELRSEVMQLRDELMTTRKEKEEALRKDLLSYIRTLPEQELRSLTNTMSQDVLVAMKGLVNAVMTGIGDGQIGPNTVTEQSGEAMAQLCMWQLCIGYNLRTLEVREEMKKSLSAAKSGADSGIRSEPDNSLGAFE